MERQNSKGGLSRYISPKELLSLLRVLMLPMIITSALAYPWVLFGSIMVTDSGTAAAMRMAYAIFFSATLYVVIVVLVGVKWSDWPLITAILLTIATAVNIAGFIMGPDVVALIPWIALRFVGLSLPDSTTMTIGLVLFGAFFVVVPVLSIWRLLRHAYDLDVVDYSEPVELWDLKKINESS